MERCSVTDCHKDIACRVYSHDIWWPYCWRCVRPLLDQGYLIIRIDKKCKVDGCNNKCYNHRNLCKEHRKSTKNAIRSHRERIEFLNFYTTAKGYCAYKDCTAFGTVKGFNTIWCETHFNEMVQLRDNIKHEDITKELEYRRQELKLRKDTDAGHQYFYISNYIKTIQS